MTSPNVNSRARTYQDYVVRSDRACSAATLRPGVFCMRNVTSSVTLCKLPRSQNIDVQVLRHICADVTVRFDSGRGKGKGVFARQASLVTCLLCMFVC